MIQWHCGGRIGVLVYVLMRLPFGIVMLIRRSAQLWNCIDIGSEQQLVHCVFRTDHGSHSNGVICDYIYIFSVLTGP
jgi:hypothetical protein